MVSEIRRLNYCRLYLQAVTISGITKITGDALDYSKLAGYPSLQSSNTNWITIHQERPSGKNGQYGGRQIGCGATIKVISITRSASGSFPFLNNETTISPTNIKGPPHVRDEYITDRDGRVGTKFRRLFCVPFSLFLNLVSMAKDRWWQEWTPQKVDAAGKLVSNLELKLLGALFVLGNGCSHYIVST